MPLWLRKYTFNKIKKWYDSQTPDKGEDSWVDKNVKQTHKSEPKKINLPSYVTRASKK